MYFLMTNDVEAHSLSLNREDPGNRGSGTQGRAAAAA